MKWHMDRFRFTHITADSVTAWFAFGSPFNLDLEEYPAGYRNAFIFMKTQCRPVISMLWE
jgi:hypothetical protein